MKLAYLTAARIPSERAHSIQIVKTCEALGAMPDVSLALVAPRRRGRAGNDVFLYHHLKKTFEIRYLPTIDTVAWGRLGFWLHQLLFAKLSVLWLLYHRPEVVYGRDEAILWFVQLFGFRVVWESHQGSLNWFARKLISEQTRIVVISEGLRQHYLKNGVPAEQVCVAHDGVDLGEFQTTETKEMARARLGLSASAQVALYIGSLDEWKGWRTLARSASHLRTCAVVIIGGTPLQVEEAKAEFPSVIFLGARPYGELAANQQAADVLVIPNTNTNKLSSTFTSPLKVFAHMASGIPIVASDVPSIREVMDATVATLVVQDDPEALACGIAEALAPEAITKAVFAQEQVARYTWIERAKHITAFLS